jgi:hypothetical protein
VPLLNSPWLSPKNLRFRKFWRSYLDQKLPRITNPVSDLTGDRSRYRSSMWFFEVAILEITVRFFKFVWEILPIQHTNAYMYNHVYNSWYAHTVPKNTYRNIYVTRVKGWWNIHRKNQYTTLWRNAKKFDVTRYAIIGLDCCDTGWCSRNNFLARIGLHDERGCNFMSTMMHDLSEYRVRPESARYSTLVPTVEDHYYDRVSVLHCIDLLSENRAWKFPSARKFEDNGSTKRIATYNFKRTDSIVFSNSILSAMEINLPERYL